MMTVRLVDLEVFVSELGKQIKSVAIRTPSAVVGFAFRTVLPVSERSLWWRLMDQAQSARPNSPL